MITAVVQFSPPQPVPPEDLARLSEANAPLYHGREGLVRKYYVGSDDGTRVGGIYLWETREAAEACYDDAWRERVTAAYGSEPEILWFDTPVIVDNRHDEIVTG